MATVQPAFEPEGLPDPASLSRELFRWSARALAAITWLSSGIFAIYIFALFLGALAANTPEDWNSSLPRLYVPHSLAGNLAMGAHFTMGAVLLLLGPLQLVNGIRARWPRVHRWIGWTYTLSAMVAGLGGLGFILLRGTIGGSVMSLGFGIYGALVTLAAVQTLRLGIARRFVQHRAWGIRLFALVVGSWLYRMDYGFWFLFAGRLGHNSQFTGWFDHIMVFWFYIPNLIVAEFFIRARGPSAPAWARASAAVVLLGATDFLSLATYFFTLKEWGPVIADRLS